MPANWNASPLSHGEAGASGFAHGVDARAFALDERLRAERGGGAVEALRCGAELGEMAVDEAGIEVAVAEVIGAAERGEKSGIAARTGDDCAVERVG